MWESAELQHELDKATFDKEEQRLREELLAAQYDVLESKRRALLIVVAGADGAGKGETVNLLNSWLDPRHVRTWGFGPPTDEEARHPTFWRYWRLLPPRGQTGVFFGSWYTEPIQGRVFGKHSNKDLERSLERINRFEEMLRDEDVVVLKLWFHLSRQQQKKRLQTLEKDKRTRWRVTAQDWKGFAKYDEYRAVCGKALRITSTENAPWTIVPGNNERYRSVVVGQAVLDALRLANDANPTRASHPPPLPKPPPDGKDVLSQMPRRKALKKEAYEEALEKWQGRIATALRSDKFRGRSLICVFEGADAAGKGGTIRRLTAALDARTYAVHPVAAPTEEEKRQPYLWRFWRHIPRRGRVAIFDRSWYGRVLVERVEGFCGEADWMRAYGEINDFESQLVDAGAVVAKLWLHIDPDTQLARFKAREQTVYKRFKIGAEDYRNRKKGHLYARAVHDMVERTSTEIAPWAIIDANDKLNARVESLKAIARTLQRAIGEA